MAIQSSGPLESTGMPVTNAGRASSGQNKTSSEGHGLWQRTRRAVSGGISAVCSSRARLGGRRGSLGRAAEAHGEAVDSESIGGFSTTAFPFVAARGGEAAPTAGEPTSNNGFFSHWLQSGG